MKALPINNTARKEKIFSIAYLAIFGYALITFLLIALKLGSLVNFFFPLGALIVGIILFTYSSESYVGFIWWLCFLTPLVRRLADFNGSYTVPSPVLLAPYLAILISSLTTIQKLPRAVSEGGMPFILALFGILYAYCIGFISGSPFSSTLALVEWSSPIIFGAYLFLNWRSYGEFKEVTKKAFIWGALIMGAYGIYQYLFAPDWETFWLVNFIGEDVRTISLLGSPFGIPEPMGIRVWSTMNGPYTFASFIVPGLLILLNYTGPLQPVISAAAYLSFLLSSSRTAWIGWFVSMNIFFTTLRPKQQIRFMLLVTLALLALIPLATAGPFSELIVSRLETFTNLSEDGSGSARSTTYNALFGKAISSFIGYGLGNVPNFGHILDSAILKILFELGWIGAIPYLIGLVSLVLPRHSDRKLQSDTFAGVSKSFVLGSLFMLPLAPALDGETAIAIWGFASLRLAACK
ncbi:MAG: O-antigen ligase domain-containing protein [Cyanobacteria bacterium P01_H01_bin.21]